MTAPTIHEVDFCSQVASAVNSLVEKDPSVSPINEARVEGFGKGMGRSKRKDLRFYNAQKGLILCGEVKLPGTLQGRSPYDAKLCEDAEQKAENAGIQFFFTWNVNTFVLWDRSLWDRPLLERRIHEWRLERTLQSPADVGREENLKIVKNQFLPSLLRQVADIIAGRRVDWSLPPDDIFIRSLESHLEWPVQLMSSYILEQADTNRSFAARIEQWMTSHDWAFVRSPQHEWARAVDNMSKTLAYIWANRLIFYKALLKRFPSLPRLELRSTIKGPEEALAAFNRLFQRAVERSGDYEPLLMPDATDWATSLVFQPQGAVEAWRGLIKGIDPVDFKEVSSDVVGRIFQRLIGPEERHRYGQHFTGDDVVDLINGFCVQKATDSILDPACGSGSFLVRAYYRKRILDPRRPHLDILGELFGCDIAWYPAHLATLNLAAREINEEANYPRISRRNFFDFSPGQAFCSIPDEEGKPTPVRLPLLDAVVGNPPYVKQLKIEKSDKVRFNQIANSAWPDLDLSGRSDLHCYFWPAATRLLKPGGYFGFIASSSWLDVEYGFALQGWILRHFRILAIMESATEPWFEDARVKTCITVLRLCEDEQERMRNKVRFVKFSRRLADIIGVPPSEDEGARQVAVEALVKRILSANQDVENQDFRIIIRKQEELWAEGVKAGDILRSQGIISFIKNDDDESDEDEIEIDEGGGSSKGSTKLSGGYTAGKWGRYLRAPDLYFEMMRKYKERFVPLGGIASIRRGITSGCDAFFMPKDITKEILEECPTEPSFRRRSGGASRKEAESGTLKVIEAGDGSVHPLEASFLAPEVHSLMKVNRPVVRAAEINRVVLLVRETLANLKSRAPWVWRYLRYGEVTAFASKKSKAVPVPNRSTCAARDPWYDLTGLVKPGIAFWPMAQQYRHIIAGNPEHLICNHNLFDITADKLSRREQAALVAILNSTMVGLFKTFYGRWAGTEGNLKTEVVDVNLLEIPDPRNISVSLSKRLSAALMKMSRREIGRLIEEQLMDCHDAEQARAIASGPLVLADELKQEDRRELDDAVLELSGVRTAKERKMMLVRLYEATAKHFRDIRVVEIEKMEQRSKSGARSIGLEELAKDIWDAAELKDSIPLRYWLHQQPEATIELSIPDAQPAYLPENPLFELKTVSFGKEGKVRKEYATREQAQLVCLLSGYGLTGKVALPDDKAAGKKLLERLVKRMEEVTLWFKELAESRSGEERVQTQLIEILKRRFVGEAKEEAQRGARGTGGVDSPS